MLEGLNLKVLVVDDFETVRVLFIKYLSDMGVEDITEAEDGKMAHSKIEEAQSSGRQFDLIFCDWNMPEMSGLELLDVLRKDEKYANLPFIMVTANSDENEVLQAMRAGVTEYLVKPFDGKSLGRTIIRVLGQKAAAS